MYLRPVLVYPTNISNFQSFGHFFLSQNPKSFFSVYAFFYNLVYHYYNYVECFNSILI